ncbi:PREDICTED: uncharacterized protein C12orf45-like [Priapulus caudatus]|uniref:Uncharacterized protein C12orf45-like n=1 Tax=Priapulus caudatus TaxID=37621 RepID=A0ABM1EP26_PRICU|nr:PREDICTED: uncharacterized protein C12orf45-like [Priapulus caudatus]
MSEPSIDGKEKSCELSNEEGVNTRTGAAGRGLSQIRTSNELTDEELATVPRKDLMLPQNKAKLDRPRETFRTQRSSLLTKVKDFLPQMAQAQRHLEKVDNPHQLDIENLNGYDGPVIEMDIGLFNYSGESDSESSDSDSDADSDHDSDDGAVGNNGIIREGGISLIKEVQPTETSQNQQ